MRLSLMVALPLFALVVGANSAHPQGQFPAGGFGRPAPPMNVPPPGARPTVPVGQPAGLVVHVEITGHRNVKIEDINKHLKTRKGRLYDPQILRDDVRRLYATRLFHNVTTDAKLYRDGVVVTVNVFERPTIGDIKFIGNQRISDRSLLRQSGLVQGEALNIYTVQEARRKVEEFYHSKGYPKTTVEIFEGDRPRDQRVVLLINEGKLERLWKVNFIGNDRRLATDGRLKTQIKSKPGFMGYLFRGKVDRSKIDQDVERLTVYYRGLGYFRARVSRILDYDDSGQWLTLTFVIDEGPRYRVRDVKFVGNEQFASQALLDQLEMHAGEYFQLTKMQQDENMLRDLYGGQGYIGADIRSNPRFLLEPGQLDLVYEIKEGDRFRVGKINIHIAGEHPHTKKSVILNRLSIRPGDIIDIREVRASERRLRASQLFETNPTLGDPPRIAIRLPTLDEVESIASSSRGNPNYRGQSPDGSRDMVLDVHVPRFRVRRY